jgi:Zn-dependent protease/predicted transcriptional regulator
MQLRSGIRIGSILGIPLFLHWSLFVLLGLVAFSSGEQFHAQHAAWTMQQCWILSLAVGVLFLASIIFHELGHSVIALRYHIPVVSITLFIVGGLAQISREPDKASQEFNIAIAGPLASLILGAGFFGVLALLTPNGLLWAGAALLAWFNFAFAAFNLLPGFPMDGGRILRAIVWWIKGDFAVATRVAARGGQFLAYGMMLLGVWSVFEKGEIADVVGGQMGGLWLVLIGWFLLTAAQQSYAHVAIRGMLTGLRAADIMTPDVPTVARDISLEDYVHEVLRTGRRCHVVTGNGMAVGLVTLHRVKTFPRDEWANTSVQAAMVPQNGIHWVSPAEPVLGVLERMQAQDINQMPVLEQGHIIGMIARDSILHVIQTRLQAGRLAQQ